MIFDARAMEQRSVGARYDVVIVGAGTVGLVIANRLASHRLSVALLEAGGGTATTAGTRGGAESIGIRHAGTTIGRAVGLGGTSALWGGQLVEFVEQDLERYGHSWPLDYSELSYWYEQVYRELGLPKRCADSEYRREFGIDAVEFDRIEPFFTFWLPEPNIAAYYRKTLRASDGPSIFLNAVVTDIDFENGLARSVLAVTGGGRQLRLDAGIVVLAAGTIGNARLMLSLKEFGRAPWRGNDNVGRYFQDHIGATVGDIQVHDDRRFRAWFENGFALGRKLQPKLRPSSSVRSELATGACGYFGFRSSAKEQIANIKQLAKSARSGLTYSQLRTLPRDVAKVGRALAPLVWRYVRDHRILALYDLGIDFLVQAEQLPIETSRIKLKVGGAPGADGLLPVEVDWQMDGGEIETIRRFTLDAAEFLSANGLARLEIRPWVLASEDIRIHQSGDTYHQCGGLRMGTSPASSVTDCDGLIWETRNVFAAGASVFPTSSYANCTLTAMALSLRLADNIVRRAERAS